MTQSTHAKCIQKPSPAERGKALITAWRESGLSQVAYARQQRIGQHLLTYWGKKFPVPGETAAMPAESVEPAATATALADAFVQVPVPLPRQPPIDQRHSPIEIRLAGGAQLRVAPGVDPMLLRLVLQTLAGSTC